MDAYKLTLTWNSHCILLHSLGMHTVNHSIKSLSWAFPGVTLEWLWQREKERELFFCITTARCDMCAMPQHCQWLESHAFLTQTWMPLGLTSCLKNIKPPFELSAEVGVGVRGGWALFLYRNMSIFFFFSRHVRLRLTSSRIRRPFISVGLTMRHRLKQRVKDLKTRGESKVISWFVSCLRIIFILSSLGNIKLNRCLFDSDYSHGVRSVCLSVFSWLRSLLSAAEMPRITKRYF